MNNMDIASRREIRLFFKPPCINLTFLFDKIGWERVALPRLLQKRGAISSARGGSGRGLSEIPAL
jgi:hypothetical protein